MMVDERKPIQKQIQLPFSKAAKMAWQNIRVRPGRSVLVMSGIVLAMAFLTNILSLDALEKNVAENAPARLVRELERRGTVDAEDARFQTRWMVGLALTIAFVGILNAMLLSVTERFHEIGTMKCLGALDSLIIRLFLLESLFQGVAGTSLGLGIGLALTIAEGAAAYGMVVWSLLPGGALLRIVGMCFALGVGLTVIAALYPAWRAARMPPVAALRLEV